MDTYNVYFDFVCNDEEMRDIIKGVYLDSAEQICKLLGIEYEMIVAIVGAYDNCCLNTRELTYMQFLVLHSPEGSTSFEATLVDDEKDKKRIISRYMSREEVMNLPPIREKSS